MPVRPCLLPRAGCSVSALPVLRSLRKGPGKEEEIAAEDKDDQDDVEEDLGPGIQAALGSKGCQAVVGRMEKDAGDQGPA